MLPWLLREWRLLHTYVGVASVLVAVGMGGNGQGRGTEGTRGRAVLQALDHRPQLTQGLKMSLPAASFEETMGLVQIY